MKFLCTSFLIIIIAFIATPTLISLVVKKANTSYFYNMCEEVENQETFSDIKSIPINNYIIINSSSGELAKLNVLIEHNICFTNLAHQIFSPPPNLL